MQTRSRIFWMMLLTQSLQQTPTRHQLTSKCQAQRGLLRSNRRYNKLISWATFSKAWLVLKSMKRLITKWTNKRFKRMMTFSISTIWVSKRISSCLIKKHSWKTSKNPGDTLIKFRLARILKSRPRLLNTRKTLSLQSSLSSLVSLYTAKAWAHSFRVKRMIKRLLNFSSLMRINLFWALSLSKTRLSLKLRKIKESPCCLQRIQIPKNKSPKMKTQRKLKAPSRSFAKSEIAK